MGIEHAQTAVAFQLARKKNNVGYVNSRNCIWSENCFISVHVTLDLHRDVEVLGTV